MLEEWNSIQSTGIRVDTEHEEFEVAGSQSRSRHAADHLFTVEVLERNPSRNHGAVTSMVAGNNVILVGTSRGWIVRHDFSGIEPLELDLSSSRVSDQAIYRVFIDPGGRHSLAVVRSSNGAETHYIHARWRKSRLLNKMKGLVINAVAWNRQQLSEAITRDIIIGTSTGQLYETSLEEKDKREKALKLLFELSELPEPFVSLQMESVTAGQNIRYFIMGVTPTKLYTFTGTGTLEVVFAAYAERVIHFTELPGEMPNSEVHFSAKQRRSERFAWLAGPGIYHGELNIRAQHSVLNNGDENFVENKSLVEYSKISDKSDIKPHSLALTEFHFLVLYDDKLKVVNRVSQKVVEEKKFDISGDGSSVMLGLCTDAIAGAVYAFNEDSIYEILIHDEGRDMWQVYLEMKDYAAALEHCRDIVQKDHVYAVQAETALAAGDYTRAASFYAKTQSVVAFEEIVLKFVTAGEQDALRTFLLRKLDNLYKEDRSQLTLISTWATELYLDKINALQLDKQNDEPVDNDCALEYQTILKEFRAFLSDCKDVLDEATTLKLLSSYGRVEELVFFASLKEQHETVIHHYIQQGDAKKALAVFKKPNVPLELLYKFAPALIMLDAYETVEFWMSTPSLNPRRLIPAIMRYSSECHPKGEPHEAIKYLEFSIQRQQNEDSAIHNLLLSLYAKQEDESALLQFLDCKYGRGKPGRTDIFYDPKYALRLCLKERRMRACVYIYSMMDMHEEAVALALQIDTELAKAEADKVEDDPDLQKKLWLMVAKKVIQQEKGMERENIRKAIAFLKETDGLLKIEDILPFFPDFALIDDFKEAIILSLEDYNKQIEKLKHEMNEATRGADNIRRDINALSQRYSVISRDEKCGVCGQRILTTGSKNARGYNMSIAPFYVFPCEHTFHAKCLISHVIQYTNKDERDRIFELQQRIMILTTPGTTLPSGKSCLHEEYASSDDNKHQHIDQVYAQLDTAVAGECPYCGEMMIKEIALPFISSYDKDLAASWEIRMQDS